MTIVPASEVDTVLRTALCEMPKARAGEDKPKHAVLPHAEKPAAGLQA